MSEVRPKTIFCDIDGTLVEQSSPDQTASHEFSPKILMGTLDKLKEWDKKGYNIILTTGRKESMRKATEKQLSLCGIYYDQLIMGIGGGERIIINNLKPNGTKNYCSAINIPIDTGISNIDI